MERHIDNGTPKRHCGLKTGHPRHWNINPTDGTYCDGVPELGHFVELTVRVPMVAFFGNDPTTQDKVMQLLHDEGLGIILDELVDADTRCALRVRSGDGEDKMYPLLAGRRWPGFKLGQPGFEVAQDDKGQQ